MRNNMTDLKLTQLAGSIAAIYGLWTTTAMVPDIKYYLEKRNASR